MPNDSDSKVLSVMISHLTEKVDNFQKSIDTVSDKIEKLEDRIREDNKEFREKIEQINSVKIPSITEELSALRTKAMMAGGFLGTLASFLVSFVLWIIESVHR